MSLSVNCVPLINLSIRECLTSNFASYYNEDKHPEWEKKQKKNLQIFKRLSTKFKTKFNNDLFFQRTVKEVFHDYLNSKEYSEEIKKLPEEERQLYKKYFEGDKKHTPNIIEYFEHSFGNNVKKKKK